jgi:hypothetical protein
MTEPLRCAFPGPVATWISFITCRAWLRPRDGKGIPLDTCFGQQAAVGNPTPLCPACYYFALLMLSAEEYFGSETLAEVVCRDYGQKVIEP